jgi:acyl-coenzyme A synthetase/AMP-(fatty) acid ligase
VVVLRNGNDADAAELPGELRVWVSERLRSTRAPERIEFRTELPYSDTGKLLRRVLKAELSLGPTA